MTGPQYAEEDANPPPCRCACCGAVKDDGVFVQHDWICMDCWHAPTKLRLWLEQKEAV